MRLITITLLLTLSWMVGGCNTHTVLGSDIPPIPEMHKVKLEAQHSRAQNGLLGQVHFQGTCHNALDSVDATVVEFRDQGWNVVTVSGDEDEATATLWKEGRDAHLLIRRNATVPDQSVGAIAVKPGAWTPAPSIPDTSAPAPPVSPAPSADVEPSTEHDAPAPDQTVPTEKSDSDVQADPSPHAGEQEDTPTTTPDSEPPADNDTTTPTDTPETPADDELLDILDDEPKPQSDP